MITPLDPVVRALIDAQSDRAISLANAALARIHAGADPVITETGRLLREARELAVTHAPTVLEARKVQVEVNQYMEANCPKTMWDFNDVRTLNPALAQKHLDINTQFQAGSDRLRTLSDSAHQARVATYKAIAKIVVEEMRNGIARGEGDSVGNNFVAAYSAVGLLREELLGENAHNSNVMLNEFFRYAILAHGKSAGTNFYENSSVAEVVGKGLGLKSAKEARPVLFDLIVEKRNAMMETQTEAPSM